MTHNTIAIIQVYLPKTKAPCPLFISVKIYTIVVVIAIALETGAPKNHTDLGL